MHEEHVAVGVAKVDVEDVAQHKEEVAEEEEDRNTAVPLLLFLIQPPQLSSNHIKKLEKPQTPILSIRIRVRRYPCNKTLLFNTKQIVR